MRAQLAAADEVAATLAPQLEQEQKNVLRDEVANQMAEALQVIKTATAACRNILGAAASPEGDLLSQEGRSFGIEGNPSVQRGPSSVVRHDGLANPSPGESTRIASLAALKATPGRSFVPGHMEPDLLFLLQENKVDNSIIEILDSNGLASISDFAGIEKDEEALRTTLMTSFGIGCGWKGKIQVLRVLRSFQDAKLKVAATATVKATVRAHGDKLEMAAGDFENLAALLEVARSGKKVPDDQLPGRAVVEDILDRLEAGNVIAEPLAEIVSYKDEEKVRAKGALEPLLSIAEDGTVRRRVPGQGCAADYIRRSSKKVRHPGQRLGHGSLARSITECR